MARAFIQNTGRYARDRWHAVISNAVNQIGIEPMAARTRRRLWPPEAEEDPADVARGSRRPAPEDAASVGNRPGRQPGRQGAGRPGSLSPAL